MIALNMMILLIVLTLDIDTYLDLEDNLQFHCRTRWMFNLLTIMLVRQTDDMEAVISSVLVVW